MKSGPRRLATPLSASGVAVIIAIELTLAFFLGMGSKGEIRINQAKRGYDVTDDNQGALGWLNP